MKRYMLTAATHYEWADGEWVTAKDALAAIEQARREEREAIIMLNRQILPPTMSGMVEPYIRARREGK